MFAYVGAIKLLVATPSILKMRWSCSLHTDMNLRGENVPSNKQFYFVSKYTVEYEKEWSFHFSKRWCPEQKKASYRYLYYRNLSMRTESSIIISTTIGATKRDVWKYSANDNRLTAANRNQNGRKKETFLSNFECSGYPINCVRRFVVAKLQNQTNESKTL